VSTLTLPELEQAANGVINILKSVPEFFNARIIAIGGISAITYNNHTVQSTFVNEKSVWLGIGILTDVAGRQLSYHCGKCSVLQVIRMIRLEWVQT
jgi:hypothetical protein